MVLEGSENGNSSKNNP